MPNCLNQVFLICPSLWSCLAGPYRRLRPRASLLMLLMASARWLPDVPQTSLRWKTKRNPPVRRRRLGIIVRISSPQMLNVDVDSCRKSDLLNNFHISFIHPAPYTSPPCTTCARPKTSWRLSWTACFRKRARFVVLWGIWNKIIPKVLRWLRQSLGARVVFKST